MPVKASRKRRNQLALARKRVGANRDSSSSSSGPVPETESEPSPDSLEDAIPVQESASKRKLSMFKDTVPLADDGENLLVDFTLLEALVRPLACPLCSENTLQLQVCTSANQGFVRKMVVLCTSCNQEVSMSHTSRLLSDRSYDMNRRVVAASLVTGLGPEGLNKFCEVMNLPSLHHKTFASHVSFIGSKLTDFRDRVIGEAVDKVRQAYGTQEGVVDIDVSYDGSWQTRGHTSMSGLGCVIDSKTGLVVDFHTMSRYCYVCSTTGEKLKKESEERYRAWFASHQRVCGKNHEGSAGSMEQKGAVELFGRSLQRGMRYRTVLSDGDTNTIKEIHTLDPYPGMKVEKLECVNHVAKRVGKGLRTLVSDRKKQGVTLGGRGNGQLTEKKMVKLQKYYRKAILSNPDTASMKAAIWSTVEHCTSTDAEPRHDNCPKGSTSYCFYQRALAKAEPPPSHDSSTFLNAKVAAEIKPLYDRLTDDDLLRRCLLGKTQNVNESIHSVIWARCPKHMFVRKQRLDIAVSLGVAEFNMGSLGTKLFVDIIGLTSGKSSSCLGQRRDRKRVRLAEKAASTTAKRRRAIIRNAMAAEEQRIEDAEGGPQYVAGGF